ncbi:MAG: putative lipid II flippase FtsW [Acidobacteria bacterium]|nr:putative lipid II flippase FtsW [Acidobacteriota bacterium]
MASRWLAVDRYLFFAATTLIAGGLVMVYSASFAVSNHNFGHDMQHVTRQSIAVLVGLVLLLLGMFIDYRRYQKPVVVAIAVLGIIAALVVVLALPASRGSSRWIPLGVFNVQPSEFAKLVVILFLASFLSRKAERLNEFKRGILPISLVVGSITLLVAVEPDLGTACMIAAIAGSMLWVGGLSWKYVANLGAIAIVAATAQIMRSGYQSRRIVAFLDPWADARGAGYQTVQSLTAVGSGGLTGVGFAEGQQKTGFLPDPYTDFIYAVIAEEFGLVGALVVVSLFMVLLWRGFRAALRAPDPFGFYVGIGLSAFLVIQALINMSIVVNLLPTTGIPLPMISYGGSSMLVSCIAVGILLNISQHAHT